MKKQASQVALTAIAMAAAAPAFAQSSVTLYGIVDNGIGYQSNAMTLSSTSGGKSVVRMNQGVWAAAVSA